MLNMNRFSVHLLFLVLVLSLMGCEGFFGTKTDIDFLDVPVFNDREVAYVPVQPVWEGFVYPTDIITGYDELIYVADSGASEIVSFDQAGNELGRFEIPGLSAIAQDQRLNLLVTGTIDTTVGSEVFTLPAVYRLDLFDGTNYGLQYARIDTVLVHPFYFKAGDPVRSNESVRFLGIATMKDNFYYVSRTGPANLATQFGGPDDAILLFDGEDKFITPLVISTSLGNVRDYFKSPRGITTTAQPPQDGIPNTTRDFFFTAVDEDLLLKVQRIDQEITPNGASFKLNNLTLGDTSDADGFLYEPGRFRQPVDIALAGDQTGYIFVVDASKDSLYQFNGLGFEGVRPPPSSDETKVIRSSFGGTGIGLTEFNEPRAVAYLREIVYVADAGNGRVLRFQLTTDFD